MTRALAPFLALLLLCATHLGKTVKPSKFKFLPTEVNITGGWDSALRATLNATEYCLIYFTSNTTKSKSLDRIYLTNLKLKYLKPVTFVRYQIEEEDRMERLNHGITLIPSIHMSIHGHFKHYKGVNAEENLRTWVNEILAARPIRRKTPEDIEHIDKHYFVYFSQKLFKTHKKYINTLSKLISPLMIYTGFNRTQLQQTLHDPHMLDRAFVYREYGHQHHPIDLTKPVDLLAHEIVRDEFPSWVVCNDKSYRFITEFKIPVLFYYSNGSDYETWAMIKETAHQYHEYMMPVLVNATHHDRCNKFARQFLDVKKAPAMRILNLSRGVKRFKFFGEIDAEHTFYFIKNYISGNLKSYFLNQKLKRGQMVKGVPAANHRMFKAAINDLNHRYLVYVYDPFVKSLDSDLAVLRAVAAKMAANKSFKIMAIDHFRNDVDGFHNMSLPMTFLILKRGKFALYDKETLTRAGLLEHIKRHMPNVDIDETLGSDL